MPALGQDAVALRRIGTAASGLAIDDTIIAINTQPEPSTQDVLAGLVGRVTYHNSENGFCVLRIKARGHRELITVVGHAAVIAAGEWVTLIEIAEAEAVPATELVDPRAENANLPGSSTANRDNRLSGYSIGEGGRGEYLIVVGRILLSHSHHA